MIVYFSGTGNSHYCARMLAQLLQDECVDAGHYIKHRIAADLISGKPWVFVAPTYGWQLPRIFADFLCCGSFQGCEDAWFVMTCGDDIGDAGSHIAPICRQLGLHYRGVLPVVMPENYLAMFDVPNSEEADAIIDGAAPVLEKAAGMISRGEAFPALRSGFADRLKSSLVNRCFYRFFVKAKAFYAADSCIGCGVCAEHCVLNNIALRNGKPVWGSSCTHCMACICSCPVEAIEYGAKSKGQPRYRCREFRASE